MMTSYTAIFKIKWDFPWAVNQIDYVCSQYTLICCSSCHCVSTHYQYIRCFKLHQFRWIAWLHRCRFYCAFALTWMSRAAASILFLWKYGKELDIFHSVFSRLKHQFVMERIKGLQRGISEAWNRLSTPYNQHTGVYGKKNEGKWTYMIDITFG